MIGEIMPADNPRGLFTDTHIEKMVEIFNELVHGRKDSVKSKFLDKGNVREEMAITLLSRVNKVKYRKNKERLSSTHTTGEVDLFIGDVIERANETIDTKCSWSKNTFDKARIKKFNPVYKWQGVSYMDLTGAKKHTVAYCLVNGTDKAIADEKRKVAWNYGPDPDVHEGYIKECQQIERNHIFDIEEFKNEFPYFELHSHLDEWMWDIPKEQRVHTITFERSETEIDRMKRRIDECREWMNKNLFNLTAA